MLHSAVGVRKTYVWLLTTTTQGRCVCLDCRRCTAADDRVDSSRTWSCVDEHVACKRCSQRTTANTRNSASRCCLHDLLTISHSLRLPTSLPPAAL